MRRPEARWLGAHSLLNGLHTCSAPALLCTCSALHLLCACSSRAL